MKILKIAVRDGRIYHMPLPGFPDAHQVELVDMHLDEYKALPANTDAFVRCVTSLSEPKS